MIIAVTGGKGGTGKSTIATALAWELSKESSVLLIDADVDCPNDHLLLGIEREKIESVQQRIPHIDKERCSRCGNCGAACKTKAIISIKERAPFFMPEQCNGCGACQIVCPQDAIAWQRKEIGMIYAGSLGHIHLLSGDLKPNQPVSEFVVNQLNRKIDEMRTEYDNMIIDTAAGTHCPVIAALEHADTIIAVTEPTPLGHHDLDIMLRLFKKIKKTASIIVNRSDMGDVERIKELAGKYGSEVIKEIPYSEGIVQAYSIGSPIEIPGLLAAVRR